MKETNRIGQGGFGSVFSGQWHKTDAAFKFVEIGEIKKAVKIISKKIPIEISGNITEKNIKEYAATGVDYISIGALTHSVHNIDMSLKA